LSSEGGEGARGEGARGETRIVEPSAAERAIARRAAESRATVPTLELSVERSVGTRTATGELVRASALALRGHPRANAAYRDGRFELYSRINIGVVIATEDTYAVPTVFDADARTLNELELELARLETGARSGTLTAPALTAATFTVWNAGALGVAAASIPVVPPQAAALAAGTRALTLCCDHRILYGAQAAALLEAIADHLDRDRV
jgi:pyruvate dehydrogenase E2 component (dihydrolipoyllysine-residue acetyltransferase)